MALMGRIGSGARSWVHIGLGDKVRVRVSLSTICNKLSQTRTAGNWTFRPFVSSPHWTYSTLPDYSVYLKLQACFSVRYCGARGAVFRNIVSWHPERSEAQVGCGNILRLSITSDLEIAIENISNSSFNSSSRMFISVMITNHFVAATKQLIITKTTIKCLLFSRTDKCRWYSTRSQLATVVDDGLTVLLSVLELELRLAVCLSSSVRNVAYCG